MPWSFSQNKSWWAERVPPDVIQLLPIIQLCGKHNKTHTHTPQPSPVHLEVSLPNMAHWCLPMETGQGGLRQCHGSTSPISESRIPGHVRSALIFLTMMTHELNSTCNHTNTLWMQRCGKERRERIFPAAGSASRPEWGSRSEGKWLRTWEGWAVLPTSSLQVYAWLDLGNAHSLLNSEWCLITIGDTWQIFENPNSVSPLWPSLQPSTHTSLPVCPPPRMFQANPSQTSTCRSIIWRNSGDLFAWRFCTCKELWPRNHT